RVTPAETPVVLLLEVLGVVEEQIDVLGDRAARDPVARPPGEVAGQSRLVVGDVRDARAIGLDPVADRGTGMDDQARAAPGLADPPLCLRKLVEVHPARSVHEIDWEERW